LLDRLFPAATSSWDVDRRRDQSEPDENLVSWLSRGLIAPGRALDVACGTGRNALYLASQGLVVDAVDPSPAIELAGDAEVTFHRGNILEMSLAGGYDLVYDSGYFHRLAPHRRISYVEMVNRALAPGGHFGLVCRAGGGAASDEDVYRHGGTRAYSADDLSGIFSGLDEVEHGVMTDRSVLRTALFRSRVRSGSEGRARVLRGLVKVADHRRELVDALWESTGPAETQEAVERVLGVSEPQARAVLDLQLRRLTPWQMAMIRAELDQLDG